MSSNTDKKTFNILLGNREHIEAGLKSLAKKWSKKGFTPPSWVWGKPFAANVCSTCIIESEELDTSLLAQNEKVEWRIPLTITGDAPHFAGWTFVAALTHLPEGNLIRGVPGQEVPFKYRDASPWCDHCKMNRRRADTYVLRFDSPSVPPSASSSLSASSPVCAPASTTVPSIVEGEYKQVGSSCIEDFLGSAEASKLASKAEMLAVFAALANDGCGESSGGCSNEASLEHYLPIAAYFIRVEGWVSRTRARESGGAATADRACTAMYAREEKFRVYPTEEDFELAKKAEEWAENLSDEVVNAEKGDYLHNVRLVARSGLVSPRSMGIAASIITAYERAIGKARQAKNKVNQPIVDEWVGTKGERFRNWKVRLDFLTSYETMYGTVMVCKFRTLHSVGGLNGDVGGGALLVWKASSDPGVSRSDVGKEYLLTGTIKEHGTRDNFKQTLVQRCKLTDA
jgi:hypothetical protein